MAGHYTDYCASLRHTIQDLIYSGAVSFPVSTIDTNLSPDMIADSFLAYSTHVVPPPSGLYHHVLDTQCIDIHKTLWYWRPCRCILGLHFSWSFEFVFFFILYLSFVLQLVIRVRTLCFESGPYWPIILHDVLLFHLVILLSSWVCVSVIFFLLLLILLLFHIMHFICWYLE